MPPKLNLIGSKFNSLLVIEEFGKTPSGKVTWKCLCDCGEFSIVSSGNLRSGECKTCGCGMYKVKHGFSGSNLYGVWAAMKQRCHNPKSCNYQDYGARGIFVCDHWQESFENFLADMGDSYQEGLTIERINNDGGYSPNNCKWVTPKEQSINKRKVKGTSSQYRWVQFLKREQMFRASTPKHEGKIKYLGTFKSEVEAAKAVDKFIIEHNLPHHLNFKEEINYVF